MLFCEDYSFRVVFNVTILFSTHGLEILCKECISLIQLHYWFYLIQITFVSLDTCNS